MGCNIDEGPLATATLEAISQDLFKEWSEKRKVDQHIQHSLKKRSELPIFGMKDQIMESINDNPVVLIRGNTGCGKTTQVCQVLQLLLNKLNNNNFSMYSTK